MVSALHQSEGITTDEAQIGQTIAPLLDGSPFGCVYLIGPKVAPVGYVIVTFTWSVEFGGLISMIDEFFIRENIRGRGMGSDVLISLPRTLADAGVTAIHLEVGKTNSRALSLYESLGFVARDGYQTMVRTL
jgi:ribosomal protein S18 acetylase RimI-like enzyme